MGIWLAMVGKFSKFFVPKKKTERANSFLDQDHATNLSSQILAEWGREVSSLDSLWQAPILQLWNRDPGLLESKYLRWNELTAWVETLSENFRIAMLFRSCLSSWTSLIFQVKATQTSRSCREIEVAYWLFKRNEEKVNKRVQISIWLKLDPEAGVKLIGLSLPAFGFYASFESLQLFFKSRALERTFYVKMFYF